MTLECEYNQIDNQSIEPAFPTRFNVSQKISGQMQKPAFFILIFQIHLLYYR